VLFRSMCGTMHVPLYQVNSIEITSPPLRRQSRLRIQSVTTLRLSSPHNPQPTFRPLSAHNRARSSLALSPQYLNTALASPALLPPRWHSRLVDMKAGSAAYDQLAGGSAQVEPTRRRAIGKLPHQASLCLKLRSVCSSGSISSTISSSAISSRSANSVAAAAAAVRSACVRE
jgi:hypothetical protein